MFPRQSSGQTPVLNRMGLDQLKALFDQSMRPGGDTQFDPYAVLSAIRSKTEEAKFAQAQRNMAAMQQNQAQGIGSLAQQIRREADMVQPPVNMARGGIVAFNAGGAAPKPGTETVVTPEMQAQRDQTAAQIRARELKTVEAARAKLQQLDRAVAQATEPDSKGIFARERRLTAQALRILESQGVAATLGRGVEALLPAANAAPATAVAPARAAQQVSTTPAADDQSILGPQEPLLTNQIPAPPGSPATTQPLLPGGVSFRPNTRLPDRMPGESFTDYRARSIKFQEEALKEEKRLREEREQTERDIELSRRGGRPAMSSPFVPASPQSAPQSTRRFNLVLDERDPLAREEAVPATAGQADAAATTGAATAGQSPGDVPSQRTGTDVFTDIISRMAKVQEQQNANLQNRMSELRTRRGVSDEIAAGQAGIERLMAEQLANEQRMRDERMAEARKLYESRQGELKPDIARVLRNLSSRSGALFESLGEGVEKEEQRIRTGKEESRKELTAAQRESEEAGRNILKLRMLEAQRVQLIRENRQKDVDRIDDQIAELRDKVAGQDIEALKTQADIRLRQAQVEKPSELRDRVNLAVQDPKLYDLLFPRADQKVATLDVLKQMASNYATLAKEVIDPKQKQIYLDQLARVNTLLEKIIGEPQLPPDVKAQLKEREVKVFSNGQEWTLIDGKPVRVK